MYDGRKCITRKQVNVIFKAFRNGQLVPPKGANGQRLTDGFVYRFEEVAWRYGATNNYHLSDESVLLNAQLAAIEEVVGCIVRGELEQAQRILDAKDECFLLAWLPDDFDPRKFWKRVC